MDADSDQNLFHYKDADGRDCMVPMASIDSAYVEATLSSGEKVRYDWDDPRAIEVLEYWIAKRDRGEISPSVPGEDARRDA